MIRASVILFLSAVCAFGQSYTKDFSTLSTQNPLSDGGNWTNGFTTGLDWHDMKIASGAAVGTGASGVNDDTAVVQGISWATNQLAIGIFHCPSQGSFSPELELRLLTTITAHNINGYEFNFSAMNVSSSWYDAIVRWNGAFNSFVQIGGNNTTTLPGLPSMHEVSWGMAIAYHGKQWMYLDGVEVARSTDTTFLSGSPGIGGDQNGTTGNGFTNFYATAWNSGTQWYVRTDGNDTNSGLYTNSGAAFQTISQAASVAQPGDTVNVYPGRYPETVNLTTHGTASAPITFKAVVENNPANQTIIRQWRVKSRYDIIQGFNVTGGQDLNNAAIRVEAPNGAIDGSNLIITNNTIRDGVWLKSADVTFSGNSVVIHDSANWLTNGFVAGGLIFFGADSLHVYTNHDTAHTISAISTDGKTLTVSDTLSSDAVGHYWGVFYAGSDNSAFKGIIEVLGSSVAATNLTVAGNTFSNLFGPVIQLAGGDGPNNIFSNKFYSNNGWYILQPQASKTMFRDNFILHNRNIEFWTPDELNGIQHPTNGTYFDYQENVVGSFNNPTTNLTILRCWFQDCDNQLSQIEDAVGADFCLMSSNVFVGMLQHGSLSRNHLILDHNTFYKDAFMLGESLSLGIGGSHGSTQNGFQATSNVWVDIGDHSNPANESAFTLTASTNFTLAGNFGAQAETMGFRAFGVNPGGFVVTNGDPLFVNPSNPLGPDGIPFTADDGLRPGTNSPLAIYGLGAEPALSGTVAQAKFRALISTWQDTTGTNYDLPWTALAPDARTNTMRPWATPEALGQVPCTVPFDGSESTDGVTLTNYAIRLYSWDFGDGQTVLTHLPAVSHTFTTVGTNVVVLSFTNIYGQTTSYSNSYRTLSGTNTLLKFVGTNGNDSTGNGSLATPWRTIQKAATLASANWIISVGPGNYGELVDCTQSAASNQPVKFVGHNSQVSGFNLRNSDYQVEGFYGDASTVVSFGAVFYVYNVADRVTIYNCRTGDYTNKYGVHLNNLSTNSPAQPSGFTVSNCFFSKIYGPSLDLHGTNWVALGNIIADTRSEGDAFRAWGFNNKILYNYATNLSAFGGGGHPDFIQSFGDFGEGLTNLVVEGNLIDGNDSQPMTFEHDSSGASNFSAPYTNIIFRNNAFLNQTKAGSIDVDGVKIFNNLFYKLGNFDGIHAWVYGGTRGSAFGSEVTNNAFVATGNNANTGWYPIPGDGGINNWTLTADYNFVTKTNFGAYTGFPRSGQDAHSINGGDPKFVALSTGDFRILTNSVMAGAGKTVPGVSVDFYGVSRTTPPDIGPVQSAAGVQADPLITVQPSNQTVTAPAAATFSVTATGTAPLQYQWYKGGVLIAGATASSYATPATTYSTDNGATFYCAVSSAVGGPLNSSTATLTVNSDITINTQPQNQTVTVGLTAGFSVSATGGSTLGYQWQVSTDSGATWSNVGGATSSSLNVVNCQLSDSGKQFRVIVTDTGNTLNSSAASLTVNPGAGAAGPAFTGATGRSAARGSLGFQSKRHQ